MMKADKGFGLYIHIPFCKRKCRYCDFVSFAGSGKCIDEYVSCLCRELNMRLDVKEKLKTVFIGGGSPSLLPKEAIGHILETVSKHHDISDCEVTIECNPDQADIEKLKAYLSFGINRISFGIQSLNDRELSLLGRIHDSATALNAVKTANKAGFANINGDLMFGIPSQTADSYRDSLKRLLDCNITHLSAYSLILEENTYLYEHQMDYEFPEEEELLRMQEITSQLTSEYGLKRYEISNYAKEGFNCKHNLSYWDRIDYMGAGLAAASFWKGERFNITSDLDEYIKSINALKLPIMDKEILTKHDAMAEFMFLGLRKCNGVSKEAFFDTFSEEMDEVYGEINDKYIAMGLMDLEGDRLFLNDKGLMVSNTIMCEYL